MKAYINKKKVWEIQVSHNDLLTISENKKVSND
jgi:hypothetical protein